ncbi:MAG: phage tail sheath C-terminal domain-containing protein [Acidobacteriota bacterium]
MPTYLTPGIYVEEVPGGARPIEMVGTSTAAFVGAAPASSARPNEAVAINNWTEFLKVFVQEGDASTPLSQAVFGFFLNGGGRCWVVNVGAGKPVVAAGSERGGLQLLEEVEEISIVSIPGYHDAASYEAALSHCEKLQDRVAILDPPMDPSSIDQLTRVITPDLPPAGGDKGKDDGGSGKTKKGGSAAGLRPRVSDGGFGTFYFPRIAVRDPLAGDLVWVTPSGHLAGIWARTDGTRGVHKAPANEVVRGALDVSYRLTRDEQGVLNQKGVNCIRFFAGEGIRVWGARTLAPSSSEWRYLNVRRLFIMVEESIARSTRWIVFEPNDRSLWKTIQRDISAFLERVWRSGALMGSTPEEAFFVKCDEETNPTEDIDAGIVTTLIGLAPVKPAEFVVFRISQQAPGAAGDG